MDKSPGWWRPRCNLGRATLKTTSGTLAQRSKLPTPQPMLASATSSLGILCGGVALRLPSEPLQLTLRLGKRRYGLGIRDLTA